MISRGSMDGDSNRSRKSRSKRDCMEVKGARRNEAVISFGPEDMKGVNFPHNDALEAFVQMDLQGYQLETVETTFFGFAGHAVYPEGDIVMPLTLGTRELNNAIMTTFTVVDAPSSYNIILGRTAMNELRTVASTYHQKIKSPVGSQVGEVRGDQPSFRKCYVEAVRVDQKKVRKEGKRPSGCGELDRSVEKGEVQFMTDEEQEVVEIGPVKEIRVAQDLDSSTRVSLINYLKTRDLLQTGHIREIQFPTWLSNVVLVPKSTGKWRMCVDFRDLNKACPQRPLSFAQN
ncbi:uncharacterized protein LOC142538590 [Primulina tabacum]|uniref:uncharacterized protein LOC142538590 n=1 Tax=Primulina tabacum TaxID=48773 RepID=UPI003F59F229